MLPTAHKLSLAAALLLAAAAAPAGAADFDDDHKFGHNYHPNRAATENDRTGSTYRDNNRDNRDNRNDGRWQQGEWRHGRWGVGRWDNGRWGDGRWGGGGGYGGFGRVEARASYASDYLPYYVKEWRAKESAIDIWREKVARLYGERFAHWRAAYDKQVSCDAGAGSVYCSVSARPMQGNPWWGGWYGEGRRASYGGDER